MIHAAIDHIPVLSSLVMEYLQPKEKDIVVDGTLGLGGHAKEFLKRIGPAGRLIGIDQDRQSLAVAKKNLDEYLHQCHLIEDNFKHIDRILKDLHISHVDCILLDLGISSFQLDNPLRGFSIQHEGPLDMRMSQESQISAFDLVNSLSEKEIDNILHDFGEERWHHRIAQFIVKERNFSPIETTKDLARIVLNAIPGYDRHGRIHPATRVFQAFRIAVNRELESLSIALDKCFLSLKEGGRLGVIAFHSLEDRIVKEKFRFLAKDKKGIVLTKKPLRPTDEECRFNPRSRSARWRVIERI
ncbi:MAG TPA: 16S rRNA (cytosine(1402)-N(4))-methyltransferase RsmH [Candidatus Omnitrophota bacterium]|nr:16S rRNA (cytosine(1402)-N(4))-methyltransferase RsmH [Candidatus Omnitrophota bacterium]HPN88021.1 16S rRNA (cytosine(1402)-N(4))-methyltransferase RsmH [Candidatus Omnitrophota bacterium]